MTSGAGAPNEDVYFVEDYRALHRGSKQEQLKPSQTNTACVISLSLDHVCQGQSS